MVREAEMGRGTSIRKDDASLVNSFDAVHDDPEISYIYCRLGEENISCGCDEEFMTSMSRDILDFYLAYVSVSLGDIKRVHCESVGQNNFLWRKERQVSCTLENSSTYHKIMTQDRIGLFLDSYYWLERP